MDKNSLFPPEHVIANNGCPTKSRQHLAEGTVSAGKFETKTSREIVKQCESIRVSDDFLNIFSEHHKVILCCSSSKHKKSRYDSQ